MTNPPKIEGEEGRAVNFPGETISIRDGRLRRALCRKTGPPGAGTNCERKKYITKYRKYHIKPHEKLLRFGPTLQKGGTSNFKFEQAHTRGKNMVGRWSTQLTSKELYYKTTRISKFGAKRRATVLYISITLSYAIDSMPFRSSRTLFILPLMTAPFPSPSSLPMPGSEKHLVPTEAIPTSVVGDL